MTGEEIKQSAEKYVGRKVDNQTALLIINESLDEISDLGLIYGSIEVSAKAGTWYDLPDNATFIHSVTNAEGEQYTGWKAVGGQIRFLEDGKFFVMSRRQPPHLSAIIETPQVHPLFQTAMVAYFKAYLKLQVNDESSDGLRLASKFEEQAQRAFNILRRNSRSPQQWQVVRHA